MPLAKLYVEGDLEIQVLNAILLGNPTLQRGGSKNSLNPRARNEREENKVSAGYLRDRDFDFDPPEDLSSPTVDSYVQANPLGWRWCRHEIENYLTDPAIVREALNWSIGEFEDALRQSAMTIRSYEAARWTVGVARRSIPPHYKLNTRPDGLKEIALPLSLDSSSVDHWASSSIDAHRAKIIAATDSVAVRESLEAFATRFDDAFINDVAMVLVWFSGKDLLAGMADWLISKSYANPGLFRAHIRDWIIANPERTLELLPEWVELAKVVRT